MPAKKHNKGSRAPQQSAVVEKRLSQQLEEVDRLISMGDFHSAKDLLVDLYRRFPDNPQVLSQLLDASYQTGDSERYQECCEKLLQLQPDDAELTLALAGAYLLNDRLALARKTFLAFCQKNPGHPSIDEVKRSLQEIEQELQHFAVDNQLDEQQAASLLELQERMQSLNMQGRQRQAVQVGEELLRAFPAYVPAYNNLSLLQWQLDHRDKALQLAERALHIEGDNQLALANLVIYQMLSGDIEQARAAAAKIALREDSPLLHVARVLEAFSFLGEDLRVLQAYAILSSRDDFKQSGEASAAQYHLAAVAYLRQGKEAQAVACWDLALKANPQHFNSHMNRQDLEQPVYRRQAPWSFALAQWLPQKTVREILSGLDPSQGAGDPGSFKRVVSRHLDKHPEFLELAPFMLDSGDESARDFILLLAQHSAEPRLLSALKAFSAGSCGPDQLRLHAAHILIRNGLLEPGVHRMWINGSQKEILLTDIQVKEVGRPSHSEQVSSLFDEALELLSAGDAPAAAALLEAALTLEPASADIQYNLAVALQLGGQVERSHALVEQVHREHPDYFFGRTGMAQMLYQVGDYQAAREMLAPLYRLRNMSFPELDAFCALNIDLLLAEGNLPVARSWFVFWESANPENHRLEAYRQRIEQEKG